MKRAIGLVVLVVFLLSGCIGGGGRAPLVEQTPTQKSISNDTTGEPTEEPTAEPTPEPTIEPTEEPTPEPTEKPGEAIIQKKFYKVWKNSIGSIWISVSCQIANVGEAPVRIDSVNFTVLGKDQSVLGTISAGVAYPDKIGKGEVAYAFECTTLETVSDPKEVKGIEISGAFSPAESTRETLTVSGQKFYPPKKSYDDPKVTGWITNNTKDTVSDVRVACALFDEKDNLLCVLYDYVDSAIGPGQKVAFEASALSTPPNISKSVATVKCIAYNFSWD